MFFFHVAKLSLVPVLSIKRGIRPYVSSRPWLWHRYSTKYLWLWLKERLLLKVIICIKLYNYMKNVLLVLSSILSSCELEASLLDNVCDDDLFLVVIDELKSYEELAPYLGVSSEEVYELKNDHPHTYKLAKLKFLELWREKNGAKATIHALVCAFLKLKKRQTAENIVAHVKYISTSCQPSNPDSVHPEKAVHRYPNWEDMSKEERKAVKEKLIVENREVKRKFGTCCRRISRSFERREVRVTDLQMTIEAFKKIPELASAANVGKIFYIIMQHSSFFNYQLLEDVVRDLGSDEERELLSEYKVNVLKLYLQRSIFEVPFDSIATSASKSSTYRPCLKLFERIDLSAYEILIIKQDLAELLHLPSLELACFDDGSIHLVFSIPKEVYDKCSNTSPLYEYIAEDGSSSSHVITANIVLIL